MAQVVSGESAFSVDELFFSITDARGVIRAGNDVFVRVSKHPEDELVGAAHNIIRHPDMPRGVFRLVWDALRAGAPVAGYVKNRAADGTHYWVMATMVPAGDGYLSVRLKPTAGILERLVEPAYAEVRAAERRLEAAGARPRDVAAESPAHLLELLRGAGFPDYGAFMRHALPEEIRARDAAMGDAPAVVRDGLAGALAAAAGGLRELFDGVAAFAAAHRALAGATAGILGLSRNVRISAMNGVVAAARLTGGDGATLGVVADRMSACAASIATAVDGFSDTARSTMDVLHDLEFRICLARVQVDMALYFALELGDADHDEAVRARRRLGLRELLAAVDRETAGLSEALDLLRRRLADLGGGAARIDAQLGVLDALHTAGKIEAARAADAEGFVQLFAQVRVQLDEARGHLDRLRRVTERRTDRAADVAPVRTAIGQARALAA